MINFTESNTPHILVSPDGMLCTQTHNPLHKEPPLYACEFKCPTPGKYKLPVHYEIPTYYVCQLLAEMAALKVRDLIFVSYSKESSTLFKVTFDEDLWSEINNESQTLYLCHKPKRRPKNRYSQ